MEFICRFQRYTDLCAILYVMYFCTSLMYKIAEVTVVEITVFKNVTFICKAGGLIYLKIQMHSLQSEDVRSQT